jgi:hypothetical protein
MPYPQFHACRLRQPSAFQPDSFKTMTRDHHGKKYDVIIGKLKGESASTEQAFRYPKDVWTTKLARGHCQSHKGISFEPAKEGKSAEEILGKMCPIAEAALREYQTADAAFDDYATNGLHQYGETFEEFMCWTFAKGMLNAN